MVMFVEKSDQLLFFECVRLRKEIQYYGKYIQYIYIFILFYFLFILLTNTEIIETCHYIVVCSRDRHTQKKFTVGPSIGHNCMRENTIL